MSRARARITVAIALMVLGTAITTCQGDNRAVAVRIGTVEERIGGPKALGEIGDYLLENDKIRVIIHGPGNNRANTLFSGSLIDADIQRPRGSRERGNDQLQELFPAFAFETVNPSSFEITRTGADGGEAVVTIEGTGGELFQMAALLNTALLFPQNLRFRIAYKLEPGKNYVTIETTVINDSDSLHPLPYLDPPELVELGLDIPGLDDLEFSTPFGHYLIIGGEQMPFLPGRLGHNVKFGIPELLSEPPGLPAFPGAVADFFASSGDGVSYGLTAPAGPNNYVNHFFDNYSAAQPVEDYSLLASFFFAGTVGVYHTNPPEALQPRESFTFTTYFIVGDGDIAAIGDTVYELNGIETGKLGGRVFDEKTLEPVAGASIVVQRPGPGQQTHYVTQITTDDDGDFQANLPAGSYFYSVVTRDRPRSDAKPVSIRANDTHFEWVPLAEPGRIGMQVVNEDGRNLPCKLLLVGDFDSSNRGRKSRTFLYDLALGESIRETTFDSQRTDFVENRWYSADGIFDVTVRPGTYDIVVARGPEYDAHIEERVTISEGRFIDRTVTLRRSVNTAGYVSIDTHLHAVNSPDSGMSLADRVISIAGEGVEYAAATDHNAITDYQPAIGQTGLDDWLVSSIGTEVTTFEMGHFNGFPLRHDSSSVRGGDVLWAGKDPGEIFAGLTDRARYDDVEPIIQVNHPRWESLGYFNVYNFDQTAGDVIGKTGLGAVLAPFGDEFALERFSWNFELMEIINGKRQDLVHNYRVPDPLPPQPLPPPEEIPAAGEVLRDENGRIAHPGAADDWFAMLNVGRRIVGIGASDSHSAHHEAGAPRTMVYLGEGKDVPGAFSDRQVIAALRSGRAILTMGPMIELFVNGEPIGSDVVDGDGTVDLEIRVQVPNWMDVDRAIVYGNGEIVLDIPLSPGSREHNVTEQVTVERDTWFLLEVTGPTNLFPVITPREFLNTTPLEILNALSSSLDLSSFLQPFGNLKPSEAQTVVPQALTNPIWVDVDGGGFQPPGIAPIPTKLPRAAPDVRDAFDRVPEVER